MTDSEFSDYLYRAVSSNRKYQLVRNGVRFEDFVKSLLTKKGKCAICSVYLNIESRKWHIDYDKENKMRGILCHFCNTNLVPIIEKNFELVLETMKYLGKTF